MQVSRHDSRAIAALALVICAALLGIECANYFFRGVHDVDAVGSKSTLVTEFGANVPVSQSFIVRRDGLRAVTVSISSDQAAVIGFDFALIRKGVRADWPDEPIAKRRVQMSLPAGVTKETIEFPPVSRSKERTFVATFTLSDAMRRGSSAGDPHVALAAWSDDAFRGGSLKVGPDDWWGDLAFSVQVDPPTRLGRLIASMNASLAPALELGRLTIVAFAALYALLLGCVCYFGVRMWRHVDVWKQAVTELIALGTPEGRVRHSIRVAGTMTFAVATPLLFTAILVTRERVSVHLLDQLDTARLESPAGMHLAFSRVEEVINGVSPPALFAHPPSRATWTVTVPVGKPVFKTSVALRPYVWEHRSDGVTFDVSISDGSHETTLTRFLNPSYQMNDRAWVELAADLSRQYAGKMVHVSLSTSPGPRGDVAYDWALWGDPRVISLRWFDRYGRAMRVLNRDRSGD